MPIDFCSPYTAPRALNLGRGSRDLNGDGFDDLAVGSYYEAPAWMDPGRVHVYFGRPGTTVDMTIDGLLLGVAPADQFGTATAIAGDLNADGFADLVVGAPTAGGEIPAHGRAYVYFGGAGTTFDLTPDAILSGEAGNDRFGFAVAAAGDFNGDGYDDVIIGAPGSIVDEPRAGRAYLYMGGEGVTMDPTPDAIFNGFVDGTLGHAVAAAGDIDGDGLDDVLIGAPAYENEQFIGTGRVQLYLGNVGPTLDAAADAMISTGDRGDGLGRSVASAGDVNGDGADDVIVSTRHRFRASLYLGEADRPFDTTADSSFVDAGPQQFFGVNVGTAGDVNGDGFDELMIGSFRRGSGIGGQIHLYLGGNEGLFDSVADAQWRAESSEDRFSISAAGVGDLNGDGLDDLVIGAAFNELSGIGTGRFYYVHGAAAAGALPPLHPTRTVIGALRTRLGTSIATGPPR